jgi:hypothetical protein
MPLFTKEELEKKIRFNKECETIGNILLGVFSILSMIYNHNATVILFIVFFVLSVDSNTRIRMYEMELKRLLK